MVRYGLLPRQIPKRSTVKQWCAGTKITQDFLKCHYIEARFPLNSFIDLLKRLNLIFLL